MEINVVTTTPICVALAVNDCDGLQHVWKLALSHDVSDIRQWKFALWIKKLIGAKRNTCMYISLLGCY